MITRRKINRFSSQPKVAQSIRPEGGASLQTVNVASGIVEPDRALVPLVLTPEIGYNIAHLGISVDNAAALLTDGHWYRLDNSTSGPVAAAEITNGMPLPAGLGIAPHTDRYEIDTTVGSSTYGRLTIYENTPAGNPYTYLFKARLNVGDGVDVMAQFGTETTRIETMPELYFDSAAESIYNPWEDGRYFSIHPHIRPAGYTAVFAWESFHENTWAALGVSIFDWSAKPDGDGIIIDRKYLPDVLRLRCKATVDVGGSPVVITRTVTHRRLLPRFTFDIERIGDILPDTRTINPYAHIISGRSPVTEAARLAELQIAWYGADTTPIAYGLQPAIPVSQLGAAMDIGLDVRDKGGHKALLTPDGSAKVLTTADGTVLLIQHPDS